jgi:hypothetical protein
MSDQEWAERYFWRHVDKNGPIPAHCPELGPCWIWTGYRRAKGYGQATFRGKAQTTHKISWALVHGPIPVELWVLHKCDVRACVRPTHLFLGTAIDNTLDMIAKGRQWNGSSEVRRKYVPRAERHWNSKLTRVAVLESRYLIAFAEYEGRRTAPILRELSAKHGVSKATIIDAVRYRTWA